MAVIAARTPIRRRAATKLRSVRSAKVAAGRRLGGVGLHRLRRQQRLGGAARGGRDPVLVLAAEAPQPPAQEHDGHDDRRHDQEHEPRELGRGPEQQRHAADQDQRLRSATETEEPRTDRISVVSVVMRLSTSPVMSRS